MIKKNSVFIATSLDGYIADQQGRIDWLHAIPNPDNIDMGYAAFTAHIDALVMGRTTFETVLGFGIEWPYDKPVYVLSTTLKEVPKELEGKVFILNGALNEVLTKIHQQGHHRLYIDGGRVIQSFLAEDLIDELIISIIPILLGGGIPLFGDLEQDLKFECFDTKHFLGKIAQNHYRRIR